MYINNFGKKDELVNPESWLFEENERIGSNRGYIWSRSLPLVKSRPIIGNGPDSYALVFPQRDYVMRANVFGDTMKIVDKPHNQYVGILVEFGVLGLICFLYWLFVLIKSNHSCILSMALFNVIFFICIL